VTGLSDTDLSAELKATFGFLMDNIAGVIADLDIDSFFNGSTEVQTRYV
jgi:hypothetical protein